MRHCIKLSHLLNNVQRVIRQNTTLNDHSDCKKNELNMKSHNWIQRIFSSSNGSYLFQPFFSFFSITVLTKLFTNNFTDIEIKYNTDESVKLNNVSTAVEDSGNRKISEIFDKFCLLMWKNCLIQYRHKTQTLLLILIPILFTANLPFIRSLIRPEVNSQKTYFNAFDINAIPKL